jgi:hypothetical protein
MNRILRQAAIPEHYEEEEMIYKFNKLKSQYENNSIDHNMKYDDEYIKEQDLKCTMTNFNYMVETKLIKLREIKENLTNLSNYKKDLGDILINMKKNEMKYVDVYQTNILCINELKLERPTQLSYEALLSGDLRKSPPENEMKLDPIKLRGQLFSIKSEYVDSLCDIYEKIDEKIENETINMKKITDFLDIYKKTIDSCDTHKTKLSKYNCTICYDNEVKMCLLPCGHTFCKSCTEKVSTRCFTCNGNVTGKTRIFLLGKDDDEEVISPTGEDPEPANQEFQNLGIGQGLIGRLLGARL